MSELNHGFIAQNFLGVATNRVDVVAQPTSRVLHPGEGGYNEVLAEWDLQQNPDRSAAVSAASGREEAMNVVHTLAESSDHDVARALKDVSDSEARGEALRHVLIGGSHSVEAFYEEVAQPRLKK